MATRTIRRSKQRDKILEHLRSTEAHPTAQAIHNELLPIFPSLSLGTVYRNLNILEEQGVVRRLQFGSTFDRYDADTSSHSHFHCRVCGRIYDIPLGYGEQAQEHLSRKTGHRIEDYTVDFYGICEQCLRQAGEGKAYGLESNTVE